VDRFNLRRYPEATQKCGNNGTAAQNAENAQQSNMMSGNNGCGNNGEANGYGNNGGGGNGGHNQQQQQLNDYGVEGGFPSDEILTHSDFAFFGHSGWWDRKVELTDYFKANYAVWLEEEVYNSQTDWDAL